GSQLLAEVLGAQVYPNSQKEIGWFDIQLTDAARQGLLSHCPEAIKVFHWHGDTYTLPEGAVLLASSEATLNQGFVYGRNVVGLQFHFEVDERSIEGMNCAFDHELVKAEFVQTDAEIKSQIHLVTQNNAMLFKLLDHLEA
ncbi:MAG TPA: hypothetical protein VL947_00870, partial [Cytophagales bacterium]|nr:hypothetical protein [Cytophagales bacterium]